MVVKILILRERLVSYHWSVHDSLDKHVAFLAKYSVYANLHAITQCYCCGEKNTSVSTVQDIFEMLCNQCDIKHYSRTSDSVPVNLLPQDTSLKYNCEAQMPFQTWLDHSHLRNTKRQSSGKYWYCGNHFLLMYIPENATDLQPTLEQRRNCQCCRKGSGRSPGAISQALIFIFLPNPELLEGFSPLLLCCQTKWKSTR